MIQPVKIKDWLIGPGNPCLIVAEAGVNHNGSVDVAHRLIDEAVQAKVDAIKFQSFITEELVTPEAIKANYQAETTGTFGSQYDMLKPLELSAEQQAELKAHCEAMGLLFLCTPYENTSVDSLDRIGVAAYKIASTDTTNVPFLRHVASKGRPIILSTGMCNLTEVELAINTLKISGLESKIVILHCTSEYPAPMSDVNLRAMHTLQQAFACPVGFSDHTPGIDVSSWAVALGACIVEKHFTLDRTMKGPDHTASLEPLELAELVRTIRAVELAIGDGIKRAMPSELPNKSRMQKSLVARRAIKAGQVISADDLACKRPGTGLEPVWFDRIVGKKALHDILPEKVLAISDVDWAAP